MVKRVKYNTEKWSEIDKILMEWADNPSQGAKWGYGAFGMFPGLQTLEERTKHKGFGVWGDAPPPGLISCLGPSSLLRP